MTAKPGIVVLVGGFAGLEALFYLRHLLEERIDIPQNNNIGSVCR